MIKKTQADMLFFLLASIESEVGLIMLDISHSVLSAKKYENRLTFVKFKKEAKVRTRTKLEGRAFSVSGPTVWNNLSSQLRLIDRRCTFR